MKEKWIRRFVEVGAVPLYLSAAVLSRSAPDYGAVVEEVAKSRALLWGLLLSNGLCLLFLHLAFRRLSGL